MTKDGWEEIGKALGKALEEAKNVPRKSIYETLLDYKEKYKGEGHQDMREAFKIGANFGFNKALEFHNVKAEIEKEGKEDERCLTRCYSEVIRAVDKSYYKWRAEGKEGCQ